MSNNLNLVQVAESQNQKEITINDQSGGIDAAMTELVTLDISSSNTYAVSNAQLRGNQFITLDEASGNPASAAFTVTLPAIKRGLFIMKNDTAFTATVEIASQPLTSPTLAAGVTGLLFCDGINVGKLI